MTPDLATPIALFNFCAGEYRLGIVAAAVVRVAPFASSTDAPAGCPYIGTLLQLPLATAGVDRRLLLIAAAGRTARLIVDGPIRLTRVDKDQLLPLGRGLSRPALVGFTRDGEQLVMLLHLAWLMERACSS